MDFFTRAISILCASLLFAAPSFGAVIYHFDFYNLAYFTDLTGVEGGPGDDFSITLTYPTYVQTTGMAPIIGPAQSTSLGYSVTHAGSNIYGNWGFDDDGSASIGDGWYSYGYGLELLSFLFQPAPYRSTFYSAPGVYVGSVSGNAPSAFNGSARLTITQVPEPGTLALTGLALAGLAASRRRIR